MQTQLTPRSRAGWRRFFCFAALMMLAGTGCSTAGVHEQRLVSMPNMQFSRSVIYSYSSRIMTQIQPGLALPGGATPSVCTVCR